MTPHRGGSTLGFKDRLIFVYDILVHCLQALSTETTLIATCAESETEVFDEAQAIEIPLDLDIEVHAYIIVCIADTGRNGTFSACHLIGTDAPLIL